MDSRSPRKHVHRIRVTGSSVRTADVISGRATIYLMGDLQMVPGPVSAAEPASRCHAFRVSSLSRLGNQMSCGLQSWNYCLMQQINPVHVFDFINTGELQNVCSHRSHAAEPLLQR